MKYALELVSELLSSIIQSSWKEAIEISEVLNKLLKTYEKGC